MPKPDLIQANAFQIPLANNSVQMCVTSPPYFNQRSYAGAIRWQGGDPNCKHEGARQPNRFDYGNPGLQILNPGSAFSKYLATCPDCGAVKEDRQIGQEDTPDEFVQHMVQVFREVRRVLRPDGTLWLNLGDSYAGSQKGVGKNGKAYAGPLQALLNKGSIGIVDAPKRADSMGLKNKDLIGIPWRTALALQADGWYLRRDVIWYKKSVMPESVTDRPTTTHEYLFIFAKREKYYYDAEAIKEECEWDGRTGAKNYIVDEDGNEMRVGEGQNSLTRFTGLRNKRSVWELGPEPTQYAHFATYPQALVEPCIKAGSSEQGQCPLCGAPWVRLVERDKPPRELLSRTTLPQDGYVAGGARRGGDVNAGQKLQQWIMEHPSRTVGWKPGCKHNYQPVPQLVLDPFNGSGTTGLVARRFGRRYVGLDISSEYMDIARDRLGLKALAEWRAGIQVPVVDYQDLPLFGWQETP